MPVNSTVYNDALQQMLFMYTADYQPWKFAEGRIIRLPVDGLVGWETNCGILYVQHQLLRVDLFRVVPLFLIRFFSQTQEHQ